jgi:hypothetical protein
VNLPGHRHYEPPPLPELQELIQRIRRFSVENGTWVTVRVDVGDYYSAYIGEWTVSYFVNSFKCTAFIGSEKLFDGSLASMTVSWHKAKVAELLRLLRSAQLLDDLASIE